MNGFQCAIFRQLFFGDGFFPQNSEARFAVLLAAIILVRQPCAGFLNHQLIVGSFFGVKADQAVLQRDRCQLTNGWVCGVVAQHLVVNTESSVNVVLFLKTLSHHQTRLQADRAFAIGLMNGFKFFGCLNQSFIAFFCAHIEGLTAFVSATNKVIVSSQILHLSFKTYPITFRIFLLINELRERLVLSVILIEGGLINFLCGVDDCSSLILQLLFLISIARGFGVPN